MVTASNIIYSKSAAARILGIFYPQHIVVKEFKASVWVWVRGYKPQFMSKTVFRDHFVQRRQEASKALKVSEQLFRPRCYTVTNPTKCTSYEVKAFNHGVKCECDDYHNQIEFLGKGVCKHGYAVLAHLGYDSLSNYLADQ